MLSILLCAFWPSLCLLWINVYLGLCPFFNCVVCFFCYRIVWNLCIFWRLSLYWLLQLQRFSPSYAFYFRLYLNFSSTFNSILIGDKEITPHLIIICILSFLFPNHNWRGKETYALSLFDYVTTVVQGLVSTFCRPQEQAYYIFSSLSPPNILKYVSLCINIPWSSHFCRILNKRSLGFPSTNRDLLPSSFLWRQI